MKCYNKKDRHTSLYSHHQTLYKERFPYKPGKHTLYKNSRYINDTSNNDELTEFNDATPKAITIKYDYGDIILYHSPFKGSVNCISTAEYICQRKQFKGPFHQANNIPARSLGYPKTITLLKMLKKFIIQNQTRVDREYEDLDIIDITDDGVILMGNIYGSKFSISRFGLAKHAKVEEMKKIV